MVSRKVLLCVSALTLFCAHLLLLGGIRQVPIVGALFNKICPLPRSVPAAVYFQRMTVKGPIDGSSEEIKWLYTFSGKEEIAGILVVVDSTGGSPGHSDLIAEAVIRAAQCKPLIGYITGVALSGGYWIASSTPFLMGSQGAQIGGIGAACGVGLEERGRSIGDGFYKVPQFDENGDLDPEYIAFMQHQVNSGGRIFQQRVVQFRPMLTEQGLADLEARYFWSPEALEHKLIDAIGTFKDAVAELYKRAGSPACDRVVLLDDEGHAMASYTTDELNARREAPASSAMPQPTT